MAQRKVPRSGQRTDINDLVAAIIAQARYEWQAPTKDDYRSVCWGDEMLGFEPCMFRHECYPPGEKSKCVVGKGQRYRECLRRRSLLKQELVQFFNSDWFGFLCGGVAPGYVRKVLGVPEL